MTQVSDKYNFASLYPELLNSWDYAENNGIDPSKLSPNSNKNFIGNAKMGMLIS
jgi:hypothetical protein